MSAKRRRHPLPNSAEARHSEIPERDEAEKGAGGDAAEPIQPSPMAVDPDGRTYEPDEPAR